MKKLLPFIALTTPLMLTACGGGSSSADTPDTPTEPTPPSQATFNLGISDAPVDNAEEVIITIESITFKSDDNEVVFDTFSNESEGIVDAETITLDLLQFQGSAQFNVLEGATIDVGNYSQVIINVIDQDIESSYVTEVGGAKKSIKVPSDKLKLGGIEFAEGAETQLFTVEFNLRKSMTYKPGPDEYNLKPTGVRIVDNKDIGTISGVVDVDLINQDQGCDANLVEKHAVYLYQGHDLNSDLLADVFDSEEPNHGAPDGAIAPFESVTPSLNEETNSYTFEFGFIPVGNYTIAYSCNLGEEGDDPDTFDDILIPNPATELTTISVELDTTLTVNFPLVN